MGWSRVTTPAEECGQVLIHRTHNAIEMAHEYTKSHAKGEVILPEQFKQHAALFLDEEAKKFPPSRPHNHKIELTEDAPAQFNMRMYPMSAKEQATEDKFLDENIEKGYIMPSDIPYGFATFQVPITSLPPTTIISLWFGTPNLSSLSPSLPGWFGAMIYSCPHENTSNTVTTMGTPRIPTTVPSRLTRNQSFPNSISTMCLLRPVTNADCIASSPFPLPLCPSLLKTQSRPTPTSPSFLPLSWTNS